MERVNERHMGRRVRMQCVSLYIHRLVMDESEGRVVVVGKGYFTFIDEDSYRMQHLERRFWRITKVY
jgi:hypothetical protein